MFGSRFYAPHFAPQPRQQYNHRPQQQQQEPNFQGLFRLIDDWDRYAQRATDSSSPCRKQTQTLSTFTPKFDVKETATSYELHGELPGIDKENVHIEFTDPQTIRIRGRVERSYTAGTPPAGLLGEDDESHHGLAAAGALPQHEEQQQQQQQQEEDDEDGFEAVVLPDSTTKDDEEVEEDDHRSETGSHTGSHKSFQATVEDENEDGTVTSTTPTTTASPIATPATTTATTTTATPVAAVVPEKKKKQEVVQQPKPATPANCNNKSGWLLSERSVGEFTRIFTFPTRVEAGSVRANLRDGILSVSVPKARRHETRRILIL